MHQGVQPALCRCIGRRFSEWELLKEEHCFLVSLWAESQFQIPVQKASGLPPWLIKQTYCSWRAAKKLYVCRVLSESTNFCAPILNGTECSRHRVLINIPSRYEHWRAMYQVNNHLHQPVNEDHAPLNCQCFTFMKKPLSRSFYQSCHLARFQCSGCRLTPAEIIPVSPTHPPSFISPVSGANQECTWNSQRPCLQATQVWLG